MLVLCRWGHELSLPPKELDLRDTTTELHNQSPAQLLKSKRTLGTNGCRVKVTNKVFSGRLKAYIDPATGID